MSTTKPTLFLASSNGDALTPPVETVDDKERVRAWLAHLRATLIRDGQLGTPAVRWASVHSSDCCRLEPLDTDVWRLEYVLVDEHGVPTFVHRKLPTDWLGLCGVGSALAYLVSGESYWNARRIRESFDDKCLASGTTPNQEMEILLGLGSSAIEPFWQRVSENLQERRIRLIFTADKISSEVKTLIGFLDAEMTNVEILAAEVGCQSVK